MNSACTPPIIRNFSSLAGAPSCAVRLVTATTSCSAKGDCGLCRAPCLRGYLRGRPYADLRRLPSRPLHHGSGDCRRAPPPLLTVRSLEPPIPSHRNETHLPDIWRSGGHKYVLCRPCPWHRCAPRLLFDLSLPDSIAVALLRLETASSSVCSGSGDCSSHCAPRVLPHARLTMRRAPTLGRLTTGIHPEETANLYNLYFTSRRLRIFAPALFRDVNSSAPGLDQMPHSGQIRVHPCLALLTCTANVTG